MKTIDVWQRAAPLAPQELDERDLLASVLPGIDRGADEWVDLFLKLGQPKYADIALANSLEPVDFGLPEYRAPRYTADGADRLYGRPITEWRAFLAGNVRMDKIGSVIDVGGGSGSHLAALAASGTHPRFVLADPDPEMVQRAQRTLDGAKNFEILNVPAHEIDPATVGQFDLVLSNLVMCFTHSPTQYLRILRSLCPIGGILALQDFVVPASWSPLLSWLGAETLTLLLRSAHRPWPQGMLEKFLTGASFKIVAAEHDVLPLSKQTPAQINKWSNMLSALRAEFKIDPTQAAVPYISHYILQAV